jgi:hypothetical protein
MQPTIKCSGREDSPLISDVRHHTERNNEMKHIVTFLDILGFGETVKSNREKALNLLSDYQEITRQKIDDEKLHPVEGYSTIFQNSVMSCIKGSVL